MGSILAFAWLLAVIAAGPVSEQEPGPARRLSRFEFEETHMASPFHIVLYSTDLATARRASRAAYDRIAALNTILSDYDPESELSRLCQSAGGAPVPVSADLFEVLRRSKEIYERSGGAFDVTIAPVGRLWRRARRDHKLPDPARLAEARPLVGSDKMLLDPRTRTVQLTKPGMKLDVGGIAKGYAAQAGSRRAQEQRESRAHWWAVQGTSWSAIRPRCSRLEGRDRPRRAGQGRPHSHALARQRGCLDRRRRRAVCDHRRPPLFPYHQSEHRPRRRRPRQRHGRRARRCHGRCSRDDRRIFWAPSAG